MGFSMIAATAVLGLTLFMAVEIITSDLLPTLEDMNTSYVDMKERMQNQLQSAINITTVVRSANASTFDYNISVKNTGSTTLFTKDFIVLINGSGHQFTCSHETLYPENTAFFQVMNITGGGSQRVKVITNNGIADHFTANT
jgi:archaellum component FlaF (FlaF/FlaG flagellin family)